MINIQSYKKENYIGEKKTNKNIVKKCDLCSIIYHYLLF